MWAVCVCEKKAARHTQKWLHSCFLPGAHWLGPLKGYGHITRHGVKGQSQRGTRYRRRCVLAELPLGFLLCKTSASLCCFDTMIVLFWDRHTARTSLRPQWRMCVTLYTYTPKFSWRRFHFHSFYFRPVTQIFWHHPTSPWLAYAIKSITESHALYCQKYSLVCLRTYINSSDVSFLIRRV